MQGPELAGGWQEATLRVFGIKPCLDRMAGDREIGLREGQLAASRDMKLKLDQIKPRDRLSHGVLDLQAGVHFHEIEAVCPQAVAPVRDEFDRAGPDIADSLGSLHRGLAHGGAHVCRHAGRWGLLDDFLVAALQRAVALEQVHHIAVAVAEDLDFDMAG